LRGWNLWWLLWFIFDLLATNGSYLPLATVLVTNLQSVRSASLGSVSRRPAHHRVKIT
jgi:hypothetical protein